MIIIIPNASGKGENLREGIWFNTKLEKLLVSTRYKRLFQAPVESHNYPLKNPLFHLDWVYIVFCEKVTLSSAVASQYVIFEQPSKVLFTFNYIAYFCLELGIPVITCRVALAPRIVWRFFNSLRLILSDHCVNV